MNTRPVIESSVSPAALSVVFNQDSSCFAIGLETGFCIYNSDPCQLRVARDFNAGIGEVHMLGRANYCALVGGGRSPKYPLNKVVIWDDAKQKAVITLEFRSTVRRVRLTRNRIVVVLQNSVHVYIFSSPPEKVSITETADNPLGLCCLSSKLLAFPGRTSGQVQLVELESGNVRIVPAHTSALRAIEISPDGEVMATASEVGTLVRLFSTSTGARIAELRRGVDHATIFSISISPSSLMLAVTSDKSTLHVFDIPNLSKSVSLDQSRRLTSSMGNGSSATNGEEGPSQKWGILSKIPLLPRVFSDIYSFTSAHIELGDDTKDDQQTIEASVEAQRPQKGVLGWTSDHSIVVVSAGNGGRWEKFILAEGKDGKRYCIRDGWKRYLSPT